MARALAESQRLIVPPLRHASITQVRHVIKVEVTAGGAGQFLSR
jgi:hypothetical protein